MTTLYTILFFATFPEQRAEAAKLAAQARWRKKG